MTTDNVREFFHTRKGRIVGTVVREDGEWMNIKLHGNQTLRYSGGTYTEQHGHVMPVRKSFITGSRPLVEKCPVHQLPRNADTWMAACTCPSTAHGIEEAD